MESQYFMNPWQSIAMETQVNELNSPDCMLIDHQNLHFETALRSIVSSPSNCNMNNDSNSFMIRELIGKLGNIGNDYSENPIHSQQAMFIDGTPLNSPPKKVDLPGMDCQVVNEQSSFASAVAELIPDPDFAQRAARFSCFGSRSFDGRNSHFTMPRASSSPSMKATAPELPNSSQESTVSEQVPNGEPVSESNSRKRKAASKSKEPADSRKDIHGNAGNPESKRNKANEGIGNETTAVKTEEEEKQNKTNNAKPPEPPKDYIHVRARRGQATDSHSLAERVRREKISERMKLLQDLVPGCNKVTGKAMMLDEIINYVQSLQRQVEFLSMKLASVNTRLDCNTNIMVSKEMIQSNPTLQQPIFGIDSSETVILGHQTQQNSTLLNSGPCPNSNLQLPPLCGFNQTNILQFPSLCQDDLQSIVQMGFGQNMNQEVTLQSQNFNCANQRK